MKTPKEKTKRLSKKEGLAAIAAHNKETDDFVLATQKSREPKPESAFDVALQFKPMQGFGGGLRTEWLSGEAETFSFGLDSGAGVGNPLLTFWIKKGSTDRKYFTADVRKLCEQLCEKLG